MNKLKRFSKSAAIAVVLMILFSGCLTIILDDSSYQRPVEDEESAAVETKPQPKQPLQVMEVKPEQHTADSSLPEEDFTESVSYESQESYTIGTDISIGAEAQPEASAEVRKHDPDAVVNTAVKNKPMAGYQLTFNMIDTMAYFRDLNNPRINFATYDMIKQEWVFKNDYFDDSELDLTELYSSVSLTHEELDNMQAPPDLTERNDRTNPGHVSSGRVAEAWLRRVSDLEQEYGFKLDADAIARVDLNDRVMWGYKISQIKGHAGVYFYINDGRPTRNAIPEAYYNTSEQYWYLKKDSFDSSKIDLTQLYKRISMTHQQLDRFFPQAVIRLDKSIAAVETASSQRDLNDFISYLERGGASASDVDFFKNAAEVQGRRGVLLPFEYGKLYNVNDVGMQMGVFIPTEAAGIRDADYIRKNFDLGAVGGMQYYFEMHKEDWLLGSKIRAVRDSISIPVRLIEVVPTDREETAGILRGEELRRQVEADLEKAFGKDVTVKLSTEQADYSALEAAAGSGVGTMNRLISKLHSLYNGRYTDDAIFIDYFTNKAWIAHMDPDMSHPVGTGTYGTDWESVRYTIMHELGHSLGMRHHFTKEEVEIFTDIDEHISPECIMNYRYKSDKFCPLCRYGLGIEDAY